MGYPPGVKGYCVCDVKTDQFFNSHNVVFDKNLKLPHFTGEVLTPAVADDEDEEDSGGSALPAAPPSSPPPPSAPTPLSGPCSPLCCSSQSCTLTAAGQAFQKSLVCARVHLAWQALPVPLAPVLEQPPSPPPASSLLSP